MTVRELRAKYLEFFEGKGHRVHPSGSLIPYDVTGRLDESLLFNGAGMVQFKPYFRGVAQPPHPRLATAQKCVRTGDIESVGDLSHLTFFEMLGNFSFGDYFKSQAIAFSWEFLTSPQWLGLDPQRLAFTVFEEDDEAHAEWEMWVRQAGLDPESRIFRLGEETNYWPAGAFSSGPPGPCGPNSEMFYWVSNDEPPPSGAYGRDDFVRDEANGKWLEIWNDVFIQFEWQGRLKNPDRPHEGYAKESMPELPFRSIDTGMGLERTAAVLAGKKSVYDTDAFEGIVARIVSLGEGLRYGAEEGKDRAIRIIADHIRTACFCIADGILPGNSGRGYVLRRLIRRAVLKGQRALGFDEPFFHLVYEGVADSMGDHYTELRERRDVIVETLRNEEALFRRTVGQGTNLLAEELSGLAPGSRLAGTTAFRLYDTFGFPLEVTVEIAEEGGIFVDLEGYEAAMREAQERSRAGTDREDVYGGVASADERSTEDAPAETDFLGYACTEAPARIVRVRPGGEGKALVALDQTPFYAESGGQTGDQGVIEGGGFSLRVTNTTKSGGTFWHHVEGDSEAADWIGQSVQAVVTQGRRARILRNHTATHLLHAALRETLGGHVTQAGSYVGPDRLRFDFTHGKAMTPDELAQVERKVNEQVLANIPVQIHADLPLAEAKARGAMALFGEKYGERVRMVEIGEYSRELCGGTHVRTTGEIGLFRIVSESSAASGVRRIEAVTGEAAYEGVLEEAARIQEAAALLKAAPKDLVSAVARSLDALREERRRRERAEQASIGGGGGTDGETTELGGVAIWTKNFGEVDQKLVAAAVDQAIASRPNLVAVAAVSGEGKASFVAKAGQDAVAQGAHAGNLVREVAKIAGGGGGGRPDFATAGARNLDKLDEALAKVPEILRQMLG
jgi:alanyl-tRNA synthetase